MCSPAPAFNCSPMAQQVAKSAVVVVVFEENKKRPSFQLLGHFLIGKRRSERPVELGAGLESAVCGRPPVGASKELANCLFGANLTPSQPRAGRPAGRAAATWGLSAGPARPGLEVINLTGLRGEVAEERGESALELAQGHLLPTRGAPQRPSNGVIGNN